MNNILIIGCGGRENAIVKSLLHNETVKIYCYAPFNQPFITKCCVKYQVFENGEFSCEKCKSFCINNSIKYVIIGSEQYLNTTIVDELELIDINCICPNKILASIETR